MTQDKSKPNADDRVSFAVKKVVDLAEALQRDDAAKALADGDRESMDQILDLADAMGRAVRDLSAVSSTAGGMIDSTEKPNSPTKQALRTEGRKKSVGSRSNNRPKEIFCRDGNSLVKIGRPYDKERKYRHVVPLTLVTGVGEIIDRELSDGSEFLFPTLLGHVQKTIVKAKPYQVRIAVLWFRRNGLIVDASRGRYTSSPGLTTRIGRAKKDLQLESVAQSSKRSSKRNVKG